MGAGQLGGVALGSAGCMCPSATAGEAINGVTGILDDNFHRLEWTMSEILNGITFGRLIPAKELMMENGL